MTVGVVLDAIAIVGLLAFAVVIVGLVIVAGLIAISERKHR